MQTTEHFDYIIIGAGSAGCVLANRLSSNPKVTVLLLEAGGTDNSPFIQMPAALSIPMNSRKYNWGFWSDPEPHLGGRQMNCPRGKVLGGSSSINGMAFVRGNYKDFNHWADLGAKGWDYAGVLPYFKRVESYTGAPSSFRGQHGPITVSPGRAENPLYQAFIKAGEQAGYPRTADPNGAQQEGFGPMDMSIHNGVRCSASNAYLKPIAQNQNLEILTQAVVNKIVIAGGLVKGVTYTRGKKTYYVKADKEVILSAGPINSPRLLMQSGIGSGEYLQQQGLEVVKHLPGVGQNLMDHLELYVQYRCRQPITLYPTQRWYNKLKIGAQWLLTQKGLGATNHFEAGAFIKSDPLQEWPNIQYHFLPLAISYDGRHMPSMHGFQVHVGPMRSKSRGFVNLQNIQFNYMSHEDDWREFRYCIQHTRKIMRMPAMEPFNDGEIAPGEVVRNDTELNDYIRMNVESAYHPCGTCRMGADNLAVVDPHCRVYGIQGLRVIDSSIMPQITTGNLNAPTLMIAEKASSLILGELPLRARRAKPQASMAELADEPL